MAADEVPGPSLSCVVSCDSESHRWHMVIIFDFYIFTSLPWQNNSTALSATFDNSESLKHSRHFETNKLETDCGGVGHHSALSTSKLCRLHFRTWEEA